MVEEEYLVVINNENYEDGLPVENAEKIPNYVMEKSAARTEFYEALRSGITVKMILETRQEDWELSAHMVGGKKQYATQIEYDGAVYDIVRAYKTDSSMIEITCS